MAFRNTDGAVYFYVYNLQGDVVQLLDSSRNIVGEYVYGPYGFLENSGSLTTVARANPFRYRGYYYDSENGYYYLNARYYYPVFGRFINADNIIAQTSDFTGYNLFAYCRGNPINYRDYSGFWTEGISISGNFNFIVGVAFSVGLFWDGHGNIEWQTATVFSADEGTFSLGLMDIGIGVTIQETDRDTVKELYGLSEVFGFSYGDVLCAGIDTVFLDNNLKPNGGQLTIGFGLGFDVHYMAPKTKKLHTVRTPRVTNYTTSGGINMSPANYSTAYSKNKMVACNI